MHRQRGFTYKIIILFNQNWFFSRNMVFFTRNYFQSELLIGRILFGFLFSFSIFFSLQDYSHVYTFYSSKTKREWIFLSFIFILESFSRELYSEFAANVHVSLYWSERRIACTCVC